MTLGATQPNGGGGVVRRTPPPAADAPPQQQPPPPRQAGSPAPLSGTDPVTGATIPPVTVDTISHFATNSLPKADDFADYVNFSRPAQGQQLSQLAQLANQIVTASGVNVNALVTELQAWSSAITAAETQLNTKSAPPPPPPGTTSWPPLPGTDGDDLCRST